MKLSEFIKKLQDYRKSYGDINVVDDQVRIIDTKDIEFYKEGDNPF